jgi:hypothetical protein
LFKISKGDYELIEPDPKLAYQLQLQVAATVKKTCAPGEYKGDPKVLSSIVNAMVSEYNKLLEPALEQIASSEILKACLWQFSESNKLLREGTLEDLTDEQITAAQVKTRAYKYLAERCLAIGRENAKCSEKDVYIRYFTESLLCAEQIVSLSVVSDQIVSDVIVSDFKITIPSSDDLIRVDGNKDNFNDFTKRLSLSNQKREDLFKGRTFDRDENALSDALEPAFSEKLQFRFGEILLMMIDIDQCSRSDPDSSFNTKLIAKDKVRNFMKEQTKSVLTLTDEQCDSILAGLTVFPQNVVVDDRSFFNPQLEARALKRCFFETTFDGQPHLAWVQELIVEAIDAIPKALAFGELPQEWLLSQKIKDSVAAVSNERGDWFEKQVGRIVSGVGISGLCSKKKLGQKLDLIKLLPVPGELDFIGWSKKDQALVVFETKMLKWAAEPKNVRNQNVQFLEKKGFIEKLDNRSKWIAANIDAVVKALKSEGVPVGTPISVNAAFISFEPLFATYCVKDYPVVSIAEFVEDYSAKGKWPYTNGIRNLPSP